MDDMRPAKVAILGNLGGGKENPDGQTVRTRLLLAEFQKRLGKDRVVGVDTFHMKLNPLSCITQLFLAFRKCESILVLPNERGLKYLLRLYVFLKKFYRRNVHYLVVGGWLPKFIEENSRLVPMLKQLDTLYVQSRRMVAELTDIGLPSVQLLPNFRSFERIHGSISKPELPLKLVYLSRLIPEKGVGIAAAAVAEVNRDKSSPLCTLDIWGPIPKQYSSWFAGLEATFPREVRYRGVATPAEVVSVLANYDALVFPTRYSGEGFPGVIVDAYAAGITVLASDWQDNPETIVNLVTGVLVSTEDHHGFRDAIRWCIENLDSVASLKSNARKYAEEFHSDVIIPNLLKSLELYQPVNGEMV